MARYVVSFRKNLLGQYGREVEVCQRLIELDAGSREEAGEIAKAKFCEAERLSEWSLHADRLDVAEGDASMAR